MFNLFNNFLKPHTHEYLSPVLLEETANGDVLLDLSEAIEQLDWREGDELSWSIQGDCIVIKNITKNPELF